MTAQTDRLHPTANPPVARKDIFFSHPSEQEFARVLDFYDIEWRYEPTTFPLEWDDDGVVTVAFSPDFYLVQQDLYIELTTLRPRLMRIKHQKVRRLQELYPDVHIRLWDRSDFERFLERLGMDGRSHEFIGKEAVNNHGA